MTISALLQLGLATLVFIAAASGAKAWALAPSVGRMVLTLLLYSGGNLLMLRLVRQIGMATAFSLSSVLQLIAVNLVAILWFGEKLGWIQGLGIALAVVAVALTTLGPRFTP